MSSSRFIWRDIASMAKSPYECLRGNGMRDRTKFLLIVGVFLAARFAPLGNGRSGGPVFESFAMLHEYARDHVLLCLVPALFIAGAISVFVSQASVMKYLGARASKWMAYPVAAVSGSVLAVCSCTVLPLFSGIHRRGAGLGPATAFLYSGPAINVLAIILTARVLGLELGLARAVGAIGFSVVIGLLMQLIFRGEESRRAAAAPPPAVLPAPARRLSQDGLVFAGMVGVLVFANWARPEGTGSAVWAAIFQAKWVITAVFLATVVTAVLRWFRRDEVGEWVESTWGFTRQILPLLFAGVLVAGLFLGRPGHEGLIPSAWVARLVGGNGLFANFFAAVVAAFMYFATLTEVPIIQGLLGAGMGKGPALALLLAGPALSLPSMLVIRSVLGTRKTAVYMGLVIVLSTVAGLTYGSLSAGPPAQPQQVEDRIMSKIQILGPGCPKCQVLYERAKQAVEELNLPFEVEKVADVEALLDYGVMATPAMVVDGTVRVTGRVPSVGQLKEILS